MASVASSIELYDKISAPVNRIIGALNNMVGIFESVDSAMNNGFDPSVIDETRRAIDLATVEMNQLGDEILRNKQKQDEFNDEIEEGDSSMGSLAKTAAGILATIGIGKTAKEAIDFASDLTEVQNVVDVAFGSSSKTIDEWATTTLDAFGLNELSAKQFAGTMGAMLKSSGLTGDSVADMSMKIAELSGDMASFYNLEGAEAFNKIRSGISGETEPLKQLGINMSVANLEAYALSQGMQTAYSEMSQGEQVMLRYNYLLQATADAQGDFARTSDSFANQQKLLAENWKAFTGELASNVLPMLSKAISMLNGTIDFLASNWGIISPILGGLITLIGLYTTALTINAIKQGITNTIKTIGTIISIAHGAAITKEMIATTGMTKAQLAFNAALYASPLTWILLIIVAVIAAIYAVIAVINKVTGKTISATGVIVGAILTAVAFIWNVIVGVVDAIIQYLWTKFVEPWIGIVEWVLNVFNGGFTSFGGAVANLIGQIISWFLSLGKVVTKIIDAIFGTNWTEGLNSLQDKVLQWGKTENSITLSREAPSLNDIGVGRWAYTDAYKTGYDWGASLGESAADAFDYDKMLENMNVTAENTEEIKDALKITNEELKYMKDLAERDVINRFTTAEIKVDMTNNNNISSGMDLDGIVEYLVVGVNEAMEKTAEGVYA